MNVIECDPKAKPNGEAYKHCIAWHNIAGHNYACMDMCSKAQRLACETTQRDDKIKAGK